MVWSSKRTEENARTSKCGALALVVVSPEDDLGYHGTGYLGMIRKKKCQQGPSQRQKCLRVIIRNCPTHENIQNKRQNWYDGHEDFTYANFLNINISWCRIF